MTGAATALLGQLISDGGELLTIITGIDASATQTEHITTWVSQQHPDITVEVHHGDQPLYPYLFGVE